MAKIPTYVQDALASSVVGTPGVDNSAATALNGIASDANQVTSQLLNVASAELSAARQDATQKRIEERAYRRAIETETRQTKVGLRAAQAAIELNQAQNDLQDANLQNPDEAMKAFPNAVKAVTDKHLAGITDPLEKLQTQQAIQTRVAENTKSLSDWNSARKIQVAQQNVDAIGDALTQQTNGPNDTTKTIKAKLDKFGVENKARFTAVYGEQAEAKMRYWQEKAALNHFSAIANTGNKERLELALETMDKYVDATNKTTVYNQFRQIAAEEKRAQLAEETVSRNVKKSEGYVKLYESADAQGRYDPTVARKIIDENPGVYSPAEQRSILAHKLKSDIAIFQNKTDSELVRDNGRRFQYTMQLAAKIKTLGAQLSDRTLKREARDKAVRELTRLQERFFATTSEINQAANFIKDPSAKALVSGYVQKLGTERSEVSALLKFSSKDKQQIRAASAQRANYFQAFGTAPKIYGDPKEQAIFANSYRSRVDDMYKSAVENGRADSAIKRSVYVNNSRAAAIKDAAAAVERFRRNRGTFNGR